MMPALEMGMAMGSRAVHLLLITSLRACPSLLRSRDRLDLVSDAAADSGHQPILGHRYHHCDRGWCSGHHLAQGRGNVRVVRDRSRNWLSCLLCYWPGTLWQTGAAALADASCCCADHPARCYPSGCRDWSMNV